MTKDEMIRMAKEAEWEYADDDRGFEPLWAFATLVAAAEREACAKVADDAKEYNRHISKEIANAIRARSQS